MGREHRPTAHLRTRVLELAALGQTYGVIAKTVGISVATLKKCYGDELSAGKATNGDIEKLYEGANTDEAIKTLERVEDLKKGIIEIDGEFDSEVEFLRAIWKDNRVPLAQRIQAAQVNLPYTTGKVGETGKKQSRVDAAKASANGETPSENGGQKSKYAGLSKQLRVIGGQDAN